MADRQRPAFITFVSWAMLIQSVLLLVVVGGAMMSGVKVRPDMILPTAMTVGSALAGFIIALGLSSMQRWAAFAFIVVFCVKLAVRAAFPQLMPQVTAGTTDAIDWQNNNIVAFVQGGVCIGMLMYQHQMKGSSIAMNVTAIGAVLLCFVGIPAGALIVTKQDLSVSSPTPLAVSPPPASTNPAPSQGTATVTTTDTAPTPTPPAVTKAPPAEHHAEVDPNLDAHYKAAFEAKREGNMEEAISEFTKSIAINAKDPRTYFRRGECYFQLGAVKHSASDMRRASADFKKASTLFEKIGKHGVSVRSSKQAQEADERAKDPRYVN